MFFAFLHGEIIVFASIAVFAGFLACVIAPVVFWLWWRYTSRSESRLAIGYLLFAAIPCILLALDRSDWDLLWLLLSVAFALPLSWLVIVGLISGLIEWVHESAFVLLLCVFVNAVIIYLKSARAGRLFERDAAS
jgi:membrane protein YdbS with pleckstrin-like domain